MVGPGVRPQASSNKFSSDQRLTPFWDSVPSRGFQCIPSDAVPDLTKSAIFSCVCSRSPRSVSLRPVPSWRGRWPAQAADADWPRSERGCCRLFPSDGGPRPQIVGPTERCYRELGEVREQLELILERPLWCRGPPGALWGYLVRLPVTGSLHGPELVARHLGGGPTELPGQNRAWHLDCHLGCHWGLGSSRLGSWCQLA